MVLALPHHGHGRPFDDQDTHFLHHSTVKLPKTPRTSEEYLRKYGETKASGFWQVLMGPAGPRKEKVRKAEFNAFQGVNRDLLPKFQTLASQIQDLRPNRGVQKCPLGTHWF